jgi:type I restriction enzyme S subunit
MYSKFPLGKYVKVVGGYAFKSEDFSENGHPVVRISDITNGTVQIAKAAKIENYRIGKGLNYKIHKGDILIAMSGATTGKIGQVPDNINCEIYQNQRVGNFKIIDSAKLDKKFLRYIILSPSYQREIHKTMAGAAQPNISSSQLESFEIPLPPLDEQKRIAEVLDCADALREKRRLALNKLDQLLQSVFLEMFGDPVKNPKGWEIVQISSFVSSFQGGKSLLSESSEHFEVKHRILKVSAVTEMIYKPEQSKPVPSDYLPPSEHFVRVGDLLFSRANTTELVGAVAYVWGTPNNLLLPDKLWRFVWKNEETVSPLYVWGVFTNKDFKNELGKLGTGTSGSMKNISQGKLMNLKIPFPPLELQNKFAEVVKKIESLKAKKQNALASAENLFQSLQQKAFQGELWK